MYIITKKGGVSARHELRWPNTAALAEPGQASSLLRPSVNPRCSVPAVNLACLSKAAFTSQEKAELAEGDEAAASTPYQQMRVAKAKKSAQQSQQRKVAFDACAQRITLACLHCLLGAKIPGKVKQLWARAGIGCVGKMSKRQLVSGHPLRVRVGCLGLASTCAPHTRSSRRSTASFPTHRHTP